MSERGRNYSVAARFLGLVQSLVGGPEQLVELRTILPPASNAC